MKFDKIILDADICIKIGSSEKYRYIETLFPSIADKIYMHKVVYNEIMIPVCAKEQIDTLIHKGMIELIDQKQLDKANRKIYNATYKSLSSVMINANRPTKNAGEVSSLAMAKTMSIAYFGTDERDLQVIIDEKLNSGINNIYCVRIIDIIEMIRDGKLDGFTRKNAKILWRLSGKSKVLFDEEIWPI
jgi:predicted nucleic acid-binding protein